MAIVVRCEKDPYDLYHIVQGHQKITVLQLRQV